MSVYCLNETCFAINNPIWREFSEMSFLLIVNEKGANRIFHKI